MMFLFFEIVQFADLVVRRIDTNANQRSSSVDTGLTVVPVCALECITDRTCSLCVQGCSGVKIPFLLQPDTLE